LEGSTWLVIQTREPARLLLMPPLDPNSPQPVIDLGGPTLRDAGHDIFHRDTGAGIACASCHVEGGEDGRVWKFLPIGDRRTQAVHVGLEGTTPFHWDGAMTDLDMLMEEVFVGRMGGPRQTPERMEALARWLFALEPPAPIVDPLSEGAMRGRTLFESSSVGCVECHSGAKLTNSQSFEVGTTEPGHPLQVPSLIGIGYRAPFLHTGCATTLRARFDPACGGGDAHGKTSHLTAAEIDDLVLYLESL
jgi:cytochrome c peroxidase